MNLDSDSYGAFPRGMREFGYIEGNNLVIEWRFADGRAERLPGLAAELLQLKVNVIVASGPQAISAAQKATTTIPIVMGSSNDPIGSGFVKSLAHPEGNITGISNLASELALKQFEMLLSMIPTLSKVAVLLNPTNSGHASIVSSIQVEVKKARMKVLLVPLEAKSTQEIENAFSKMRKERVGAVIVGRDAYFNSQLSQISQLAATYRFPSIYGRTEYVEAGGLMSYGQNQADGLRNAAKYVDKILRGAKPSDLPVEQATKFELFINGKTAKAFGLKIPQSLLIMADKVIE